STVTLVGRGGDGLFGTGDDVAITPGTVVVSGGVITLDLSAQTLPNDVYRVKLSGNPAAPGTKPNLFGYWKLNEGAGTLAADSSGNGRNGTLSAGAAWANGLFGKAAALNAGVTRVDINAGTVTPSWTAS